MATKDQQKEEERNSISTIIKSVEGLFQNPNVLSMLLNSLFGSKPDSNNSVSNDPRGKTPEEIAKFEREHQILRRSPQLVEAIFNGGIRDLIAEGHTAITELDGKPKELLDILRNGRIRGAVMEKVITIEQLSKVAPDKLKEANQLLHGNIDMRYEEGIKNYKKVTELLGLDDKQAESLRSAIDKTDQKLAHQGPLATSPLTLGRSGPSVHRR